MQTELYNLTAIDAAGNVVASADGLSHRHATILQEMYRTHRNVKSVQIYNAEMIKQQTDPRHNQSAFKGGR